MDTAPGPTSPRHRLVLAGLVLGSCGLLVVWALRTQNPSLLPLELSIAAIGIPLAWTDVRQHRLPNRSMLLLYGLVAVTLVAAWAMGERHLLPAVIGAGLWSVVVGGLWLAGGGQGMGAGDVKLALVLGVGVGAVGVGAAVVALGLAFALGGLAALLALASGRRGAIPFGPALVAGWFLGLLIGEPSWAALVGR